MKPTYSISEPKQYRHLYTKPKRVQMLEGKSPPTTRVQNATPRLSERTASSSRK